MSRALKNCSKSKFNFEPLNTLAMRPLKNLKTLMKLHFRKLVRVLCPDIFQFHCACVRTEICLRELTLLRTLNPNQKSSRSVDPQFSHKLLFYVH